MKIANVAGREIAYDGYACVQVSVHFGWWARLRVLFGHRARVQIDLYFRGTQDEPIAYEGTLTFERRKHSTPK